MHKLNGKYWYIVKSSDVDMGHTIRKITRFLNLSISSYSKKKKREAKDMCHQLSWRYEDELFSITEKTLCRLLLLFVTVEMYFVPEEFPTGLTAYW